MTITSRDNKNMKCGRRLGAFMCNYMKKRKKEI